MKLHPVDISLGSSDALKADFGPEIDAVAGH